MKNILHHIVRVCLGIVFIISAILKLFPIEPFELFIFGNGITNWNLATVFARLVISMELFLGVMLIINLFSKFIQRINILILVGFTILLTYFAIVQPDMTNCNCFGEGIELSPINSIIKNIILIAFSFFVLYSRIDFKVKFQKFIAIGLLVSIFAFPIIISPPDFIYYGNYEKIDEPLETTFLQDFKNNDKQISINKGKVIVCFFSTGCKFCKHAAKKISIIQNSSDVEIPILVVFMGNEQYVDLFWEESESNKQPYIFLSAEKFLELSGKSLPKIYFLENGIKKGQAGFRNFSQSNINDFFADK